MKPHLVIERSADFERNVTSFFDENRKPADNTLYYYNTDNNKTEIPLNRTGEMIKTPYSFIAGLTIEREELYEGEKGGGTDGGDIIYNKNLCSVQLPSFCSA